MGGPQDKRDNGHNGLPGILAELLMHDFLGKHTRFSVRYEFKSRSKRLTVQVRLSVTCSVITSAGLKYGRRERFSPQGIWPAQAEKPGLVPALHLLQKQRVSAAECTPRVHTSAGMHETTKKPGKQICASRARKLTQRGKFITSLFLDCIL